MSAKERRYRSELTKLMASHAFLRGSLVERYRTCGKAGCRCARGEKHRGLYLMSSKDGKPRQLYVPPELEDTVRQWLANHERLKSLMEQVSDLQWSRIRERKP